MPRNGGRARLIVCPLCQSPRRALYAWGLNPHRLHAAVVDSWKCRECAQLRYASEGGALLHRPRTTFGKMLAAIDDFTRHDRPESLDPYVFVNPGDVKTYSKGEAERFYRELKQKGVQVRVGMEATGHSRWFERLLAERGFG